MRGKYNKANRAIRPLSHGFNYKNGDSGLFIATRASARLGVLRASRLGASANPARVKVTATVTDGTQVTVAITDTCHGVRCVTFDLATT